MMSFTEAKNFVLLFGKHSGKRLDEVAETDEGLCYLDWLNDRKTIHSKQLKEALRVYLSDPTIAKELKAITR